MTECFTKDRKRVNLLIIFLPTRIRFTREKSIRSQVHTHIYEHLDEEGSEVVAKKILKIPVHVQHNMREKNGHVVYYSQELLPDVNLITLRVNICHKNILAIT